MNPALCGLSCFHDIEAENGRHRVKPRAAIGGTGASSTSQLDDADGAAASVMGSAEQRGRPLPSSPLATTPQRQRSKIPTTLGRRPLTARRGSSMHGQLQSLFFSKLTAELRLIVYEMVLGPQHRGELCHILAPPTGLMWANVPCYEPNVDKFHLTSTPVWAHRCWGFIRQDEDEEVPRVEPERRELLSLLISCRRM